MPTVTLSLSISPEEYLAHYQGAAKEVIAKDHLGRTVRFPSNILQPFVTHSGIAGTFRIEFDDNNRFQKISKVS